jgi:fructose-specific phosphotransferase system IIC component
MKIRIVLILLVLIMVMSCFPGTLESETSRPAGFLMGIWHGWIAPLSLIVGIFDAEVHVFDSYNTGWWYEFGFYIAIISGFGSLSLSRKQRERKARRNREDD